MHTPFTPAFDESIRAAMRDFQVPGLSLAIVKDDQVIFARGYGQRAPGEPALIDEHTTFAIASISKSFTSTALAMLVDESLLCWDDPARAYLPGFDLMDPFAAREIRVRDLLIHNSGLPEVSGGTIWYGSDLGREEVVRRLRFLRPNAGFRSRYAYQNVMYLAAGQIIPALTGLSWDDFLLERVFRPLGFLDSAPNYALGMQNPNRAAPHARLPYASSGLVLPVPYRDHDNVGPAASVHASAWDLAQYLRLHLNGGSFEGAQLVRPETAAELHSSQTIIPLSQFNGGQMGQTTKFASYGMGWRVFDFRGRKMVQHSGGVDGMRTLVTMLPEERLGVVALTNAESALTYPVTYRVVDDFLGTPSFDWAAGYLQGMQKNLQEWDVFEQGILSARARGTQPSLPLEACAGRYPSPLVDALELTIEDQRLVLRFPHTPAFTADLEHWHYDTFRLNWRDPYIPWGLVSFRVGSRGHVESLRLDQPNLLDVDFNELGELAKE